MAIHFTQGGPVLSSAATKPVQCATVVYNVTVVATVVWKVGCR